MEHSVASNNQRKAPVYVVFIEPFVLSLSSEPYIYTYCFKGKFVECVEDLKRGRWVRDHSSVRSEPMNIGWLDGYWGAWPIVIKLQLVLSDTCTWHVYSMFRIELRIIGPLNNEK